MSKEMNTNQKAKLNMYRATESHCAENASTIGTIPAFQTAFNNFKEKIAEIINTTQLKDASLAGVSAGKNDTKQNLAQKAADTAAIIYAFASATKNESLKKEVKFSFTTLLKTGDDRLAPRVQNLHDRAQTNLAALNDYGITAEKLTELQTTIDSYKSATPKTRTALSQRKTYNANLRRLFKEADEILKDQMDKLIANLRASNPDFVARYEANRVIFDPATTTTQLKGKVTNKSDGTPVKGAVITIVETDTNATTNSLGEYSIKVTATGFQDLEMDKIGIKLGEINRLNFILL